METGKTVTLGTATGGSGSGGLILNGNLCLNYSSSKGLSKINSGSFWMSDVMISINSSTISSTSSKLIDSSTSLFGGLSGFATGSGTFLGLSSFYFFSWIKLICHSTDFDESTISLSSRWSGASSVAGSEDYFQDSVLYIVSSEPLFSVLFESEGLLSVIGGWLDLLWEASKPSWE